MNNPIITRELIGLLRTRKALLLQVGMVALLTMLVVMRWPSDAKVNQSGFQAQQMLRVFGYGLMIAVVILAPVFPATSIVKEKQGGTLALLLNSRMSPWSILIGKLVGTMGFIVLLLVLSLPFAAATFTMGGVGFEDVIAVYCVLFLVSLQYATIALWISSKAATTESALRFTFGAILFLAVIPLVLAQFIPEGQPMTGSLIDYLGNVSGWVETQEFGSLPFLPDGVASPVFQVLLYVLVPLVWFSRFFSPAPAMATIMQDEAVLHGLTGDGAVGRFAVFAVICSIFFLCLTARRLRPGLLDQARDAGRITDEQSTKVKAARRFWYLWFFDPQRRSGDIGKTAWYQWLAIWVIGLVVINVPLSMFVGNKTLAIIVSAVFTVGVALSVMAVRNPVTVKEFRTRRFGRSHWLMRLFMICIVLSLGLMFATTEKSQGRIETVGSIIVLLQVVLLLLVTPALAAGLISSEREGGGWELLQMTPMPAVWIVIGKLLSVIVTLLLVLLATMPGYAVLIYIKPESWQMIVDVMATLLLLTMFAMLLSAAVSSLLKNTGNATAVAYLILGVLCIGTILIRFAENAPFSHQLVESVLAINPLAAALTQIKAPMFTDYPSVAAANQWFMGVGCVICFVVLVFQTWRLTRPQ